MGRLTGTAKARASAVLYSERSGVIAADRKHTPSAQEIEILLAMRIVQILAGPAAIPLVETDRLEDAHHLLVEMTGMQRIALGLPRSKQVGDVEAHGRLQTARRRRISEADTCS